MQDPNTPREEAEDSASRDDAFNGFGQKPLERPDPPDFESAMDAGREYNRQNRPPPPPRREFPEDEGEGEEDGFLARARFPKSEDGEAPEEVATAEMLNDMDADAEPEYRSKPQRKPFFRDEEEGGTRARRPFQRRDGDRPPRRAFGDRPAYGNRDDRPRRPYDPDRPRRPFDPDRPRRPYDPDRPRRSFGDRPEGERAAEGGGDFTMRRKNFHKRKPMHGEGGGGYPRKSYGGEGASPRGEGRPYRDDRRSFDKDHRSSDDRSFGKKSFSKKPFTKKAFGGKKPFGKKNVRDDSY